MKEEALKLADCLCFIPIPKKYKQTQLEASAMIRRLVEELDKWKEEAIDQQQLAREYRKLYEEETPQTKQEHCCPDCGCHFVGEFPFNYAPQTKPTITKLDGKVVAVTMTDDEHSITKVLWEAPKPLELDEIEKLAEYHGIDSLYGAGIFEFARAIQERINNGK